MNILITGGAGFIGAHVAKALAARGDAITLIDNMNDYYSPQLKEDRLKILLKGVAYVFHQIDIADYAALEKVFQHYDCICHLAAQGGVRYSLEHPFVYEAANNLGTLNIFELAKKFKIPAIVFASSSSVYGGNEKLPFAETDNVDKPISLYAATKKYNELLAHVYHNLYGIKCTGLRFFTVYGPWGRPDMAMFKFTEAILNNKPIDVYNFGRMKRDFTFVADIVAGIIAAIDKQYAYEIINLGGDNPVELNYFIECIEKSAGKKAKKNFLPLQKGDVLNTEADCAKAKKLLGFSPQTSIEEGVQKFVEWYKGYYKHNA